ncbi:MAG TPA: TIR domain-containing protein [bacterium]|nr:TIR domain-containing protein [bacterium]
MAHDVFICHSHEDRNIAFELCEKLEKENFQCWIAPRNIPPGEDWPSAIMKAIESSKILILILSSHSKASPQVLRELERAITRRIFILPLRFENMQLDGAFEYLLGPCQIFDAFPLAIDKYLDQIISTLKSRLSRSDSIGLPDHAEQTSYNTFPVHTGTPPPYVYTPTGPQIRPWVRYWARTLDLLFTAIILSIIVLILYEPVLEKTPDIVLTIASVLLLIGAETFMLSSWGTTPGKTLLNVRVRTSEGTKLTLKESFKRSLGAALQGYGLGIPIVSLITQITSYSRLKERGRTAWDEKGNFVVSHRIVGIGRILVIVLIFVVFLFFMFLGLMQEGQI